MWPPKKIMKDVTFVARPSFLTFPLMKMLARTMTTFLNMSSTFETYASTFPFIYMSVASLTTRTSSCSI